MLKSFDQHARRLIAQIRLPFFGRITRTGKTVQVAGLNGELFPEVVNLQQVGFASGLPQDAEVVMLPLMGKTARSVIIASRGGAVLVTVNAGETCIYDQFGHTIKLTESGIAMVGNVTIQGNLTATGSISDQYGSMAQMRVIYNAHIGHVSSGVPAQQMPLTPTGGQ